MSNCVSHRYAFVGVAFGFVAILCAPAFGEDHPERRLSCVRTQAIYDWKPAGSSAVVVSTSLDKRYRVSFAAPCRHMSWSVFASVSTRPTGPIPCLSPGDVFVFGRGATLANGRYEEEERCTVRSVKPLPATTPAAQAPPHQQ
jgi:hypothetical protein